MQRALRWTAGLSVTLLIGVLVNKLHSYEASELTLDGVSLPPEDPEPFVRSLASTWLETPLSLDAGASVVRLSRRDLGASVDVDAAVQEARLARGFGPIWERLGALLGRRSRALRWKRRLDQPTALAAIDALRGRAEIEAQPVRHDGTGGHPGTRIARLSAVGAVAGALHSGVLLVRLPVQRVEAPAPTIRDRTLARYDHIVAAHETRYASGSALAGRARNIYLAARFLDGSLIEPRGSLSFNDVVGARTLERGFAPAIELARGGRRTEGVGGGVCQVAATLHAAAFFAGFDVPEHHPHTRNSNYIPAGLDTAVSWPNKDLRIQNPYPFFVRVVATARRGRLRIELLGQRRAPRVEWNTRIVRRIARRTDEEIDPALAPGAAEVVDEGGDGSVMERTRTVYWSDGAVTERQELRYPMVTRLVRVGPSRSADEVLAPQ